MKKVIVLSNSRNLYSTKRLAEEISNAGREPLVSGYKDFLLMAGKITKVANDNSYVEVHRRGKAVKGDFCIPRVGGRAYLSTRPMLEALEKTMPTVNNAKAIGISHNKWETTVALSGASLPTPKTVYVMRHQDINLAFDILGDVHGYVIKRLNGAGGKGIVIVKTIDEARPVLEMVIDESNGTAVVLQELVPCEAEDIRVITVGERVVATVKRVAKKGEKRANIHSGGSYASVDLTTEEKVLAVKAARACGLGVAGVDFLRNTKTGELLIIEVNSSPGLGSEEITGVNIAREIVEFGMTL